MKNIISHMDLIFSQSTIGSIVAFKSHPFFSTTDLDLIFIGAESLTLSPLMVVTEIVKENKSVYEEGTGKQITDKSSLQCKCLWYSHKTGHFEDAIISSNLLKIIGTGSILNDLKDATINTSVTFKTVPIELGKKKISLKQSGNEKNKSITGILSFTSPVMQIIGTAKSDSKEPFLDSRTGEVKRVISRQLVKCKYYNHISDKLSEAQIPIEALLKVNTFRETWLVELKEAIQKSRFLKVKSSNPTFVYTFIKPLGITYKAGNYYLESEDYLDNSIKEIIILNDNQFDFLDYQFQHLPKFIETGENLDFKSISKSTLIELNDNHFWRIKYTDFNGITTIRTIYNPSFLKMDISENPERPNIIDYIKATCILRKHETRYFRIDRIQTLKVLDLVASENITH